MLHARTCHFPEAVALTAITPMTTTGVTPWG